MTAADLRGFLVLRHSLKSAAYFVHVFDYFSVSKKADRFGFPLACA
jgi:hypothetical protein